MAGPDKSFAQREDETRDAWYERLERDWPETMLTLRIFAALDANAREREARVQAR